MQRRTATTLIEVLISIFIMAIGTLAILALFPLAVVKMSVAIKDDRAGHCAANARAIAEAQNIRFDTNVTPLFTNPGGGSAAPFLDQPSYAVYADPIGMYTYSGPAFIAGTTGIPRCTLACIEAVVPNLLNPSPTTATQQKAAKITNILRWCVLPDEITFNPNGTASVVNGYADRESTYSWAWLLRLPKSGNPADCEITVVVYNQRALNTAVPLAPKELAYQCSFVSDPISGNNVLNQVNLNWTTGTPQPRVQEGGWVLDASVLTTGTPSNATFYRVVSVGDIQTTGTGFAMTVELAQPLAGFSLTPTNPVQRPTIVVMDDVVEVFQSSGGWRTSSK
jgi:type II secretory pathway pseudopilin PulG